MVEGFQLERALASATSDIRKEGKSFALVGGLAVSVRAEIRFTRDIDLAVAVCDDAEAEALVRTLQGRGYKAVASVEQEAMSRLATVRLLSTEGVIVDLLFASSGIETEIAAMAQKVDLPNVGHIELAMAEELLAMKILSMTDRRLQDRIDAQNLVTFNPELDLRRVGRNLALIEGRGYARGQDLPAKLQALLRELGR